MNIISFIKKTNLLHNPYFIFFPFLLIYILIAIIFHHTGFVGDEGRYVTLAHNILNGNYPSNLYVNLLTNGPGYPIIILPFLAFELPNIAIIILNAFLYYFSIILIFKSLKKNVTQLLAASVSIFWACYYNMYELIPFILTEIFTAFLISVLIFSLTNAFTHSPSKKIKTYTLLAGFTLGYIALTKFIFGYVLLVLLIGSIILWIVNKKSINYRRGTIIVLIAFGINIPYLIYSYNQTGKLFSWGNISGDNLYWMSTPVEGEYGDWQPFPKYFDNSQSSSAQVKDESNLERDINELKGNSIRTNHEKVNERLSELNVVEMDDTLKEIAITNIKKHPLKYLQNCVCNLGRILFNYPYSYTLQRPGTLLRLPMNGIIVILLVFSFFPTILNWRKLPYSIRFMIFFSLIYLSGSIFASAETRMFTVIVPAFLIWIAYILQNTVNINLRFKEDIHQAGETPI